MYFLITPTKKKKNQWNRILSVPSLFVKEMDAEQKKSIKHGFLFLFHIDRI